MEVMAHEKSECGYRGGGRAAEKGGGEREDGMRKEDRD